MTLYNFNKWYVELEPGKHSIKYYKFYVGYTNLKNKKEIINALNLGLTVKMKDRITNEVFIFDYKTKTWIKI